MRIIVICDLGVGGERGRVLFRGGLASAVTATEYKDPMKVIKKYEDYSARRYRTERKREQR